MSVPDADALVSATAETGNDEGFVADDALAFRWSGGVPALEVEKERVLELLNGGGFVEGAVTTLA